MIVHFVCSGNSFRSRLAEAYLNSLHIPGYRATSSGAHTYLDQHDRISPQAKVVLENEGLEEYASPDKTQLSQELLDTADIVICMNKTVYREALGEGVHFPVRTYIWDIDDVGQFTAKQTQQLAENDEPLVVKAIFRNLRRHIDDLVAFLKRPRPTEQVDVLDEDGKPTGKTADITTIHEKGWWHAGVHIGLYTPSGKVLLEHRSSNIIFNPGLWDLSMGGVITSGETPETAILRELREELGINLKKSDLHQLFVWRYDHYQPHYGFHNRNFTYTYIAQIPEDSPLRFQPEEVSGAKWLPLAEVEKLNQALGASDLIRTQAYYRKILDAIATQLH